MVLKWNASGRPNQRTPKAIGIPPWSPGRADDLDVILLGWAVMPFFFAHFREVFAIFLLIRDNLRDCKADTGPSQNSTIFRYSAIFREKKREKHATAKI